MTAPKVIWASAELWTDKTWLAGEWDINSHALEGEHARYINADAPELVALVEAASKVALRCRVLSEHGQIGKWNEVSELDAALAAWEALK